MQAWAPSAARKPPGHGRNDVSDGSDGGAAGAAGRRGRGGVAAGATGAGGLAGQLAAPWEAHQGLLGGFAGGFNPKGRAAAAFPQVSEVDGGRRLRKTAQKPRTHGKIRAHFLQNRPEVAWQLSTRTGDGGVFRKRIAFRKVASRTHLRPLFTRSTLSQYRAPPFSLRILSSAFASWRAAAAG